MEGPKRTSTQKPHGNSISVKDDLWLFDTISGPGQATRKKKRFLGTGRNFEWDQEEGFVRRDFPKKNLRDIARKKTEGSEGNIGISNMESALKLILVWQQHAVGVLVADAMCVYNIRNNHV